MPPAAVRNLRDLIYWQYAKIIAQSAGVGKTEWGFVMERFQKLQSGEIGWDWLREYVKEREDPSHCVYCGEEGRLTMEHLFPRSLHGPEDDQRNVVWVCKTCNSTKGDRRLYDYWASIHGLKAAKYDVPRIAEGKYLKLVYDLMEGAGVLGTDQSSLRSRFCSGCDLSRLCQRERFAGKLSPLCLDGVATSVLRTSGGGFSP